MCSTTFGGRIIAGGLIFEHFPHKNTAPRVITAIPILYLSFIAHPPMSYVPRPDTSCKQPVRPRPYGPSRRPRNLRSTHHSTKYSSSKPPSPQDQTFKESVKQSL